MWYTREESWATVVSLGTNHYSLLIINLVAICTTKTAILSGGEQVVPVDRRAQRGPGVGHGQTVVRVRHRAQALLQLVALAALRPAPPDRFRGAAATDATSDAAAAAAAATVKSSPEAESSAAATPDTTAADHPSASAVSRRRRPEREMTRSRRRRLGDQSGRQTHAVYLNQRRIYSFARAHGT